MSGYKIETNLGNIVNCPKDAERSEYENIGKYGVGAVLERFARTRASKNGETAHAIIYPNGDRVTNF